MMRPYPGKLQLNLNLHAGGELQAHQGLHGLGRGLHHVDEALVNAALKLLAAVLILVDGPQDGDDLLSSLKYDVEFPGACGVVPRPPYG